MRLSILFVASFADKNLSKKKKSKKRSREMENEREKSRIAFESETRHLEI